MTKDEYLKYIKENFQIYQTDKPIEKKDKPIEKKGKNIQATH